VHTADVKGALPVYSIEVAARERDDLKEDPIVVRLRKVRNLSELLAAYIYSWTETIMVRLAAQATMAVDWMEF